MSELHDVRPRAIAALARLANLLNDNADTKELREAGVAPHTIDRLYPFDLVDWHTRIHELAKMDEAYDTWRFLVPSHSTLDRVVVCFAKSAAPPDTSGMLEKLRGGTAYESVEKALAARFELTVVVLEMIKRMADVEPTYRHLLPLRSTQFFAEVDQLLLAIGGKPKVDFPF